MRRLTVFLAFSYLVGACDDGGGSRDADLFDVDGDSGDAHPDADIDESDGDVESTTPCQGCQIGLVCYPNRVVHPENPCLICDVSQSLTGWSENDGAACDDGMFCTVGDVCHAGSCAGEPRSCDDGVDCNGEETCSSEQERCVPGLSTCDADELCHVADDRCVTVCTGCVVDGLCYGDGQVSSENPCLVCHAELDRAGWSDNDGAICDDGVFCNGADFCLGGECAEHAGEPCGGAECLEEEGRCCRVDAYQSCDGSGDVSLFDGCGRVIRLVEDCPELLHGACIDMRCVCEPGWGGYDCGRCVRYVDGASGDDGDAGTSWGEALATVQAGIDAAEPEGCEVWVAEGVYRPGGASPSREDSFVIPSGVALFGGFAGAELLRAERDIAAHETVFSGDIGFVDDAADNSYHVVRMEDGSRLDGVTIRGGNANRLTDETDRVGGGVVAPAAGVVVSSCRFEDNQAWNRGGAFVGSHEDVLLVSNVFVGNSSGDGGAIFFETQPGQVHNCVFRQNVALGDGGAVYADLLLYADEVVIASSTFWGNEASGRGGALAAGVDTVINVSNSILWGNEATEDAQATEAVSFVYCDVEGTIFDGMDGNWAVDPYFVNVDSAAGAIDLRLRNGSRCVNAGSAPLLVLDESDLDGDGFFDEPLPLDVDGQPRQLSTAPDLGAYELDDRVPPEVRSLEVVGHGRLRLRFNEQMDRITASDLGRYEFSGGLSASEALVAPDRRSVTFMMSPMVDCVGYTLTINGVSDVTGNMLPLGTVVPFIAEPVLLDERFDDGDTIGWTFVDEGVEGDPSRWMLIGEKLRQTRTVWGTYPYRTGTFALWDAPGAESWSDYTFRATLFTPDRDGIGVMFRVGAGDACYRLDLDYYRCFRRLSRLVGDDETVLAEDMTTAFRIEHVFEIEVRVRGDEMQLLMDGEDMFGGWIRDGTFPEGSVALYSWGNNFSEYDDVSVVGTCP